MSRRRFCGRLRPKDAVFGLVLHRDRSVSRTGVNDVVVDYNRLRTSWSFDRRWLHEYGLNKMMQHQMTCERQFTINRNRFIPCFSFSVYRSCTMQKLTTVTTKAQNTKIWKGWYNFIVYYFKLLSFPIVKLSFDINFPQLIWPNLVAYRTYVCTIRRVTGPNGRFFIALLKFSAVLRQIFDKSSNFS